MRHLDRRLERLERLEATEQGMRDGYAPEAWMRLAPWAIAVHVAGGWEAALAHVRAGRRLPDPDPYGGASGGPLWDVTLFWQCGDTSRMPSNLVAQDILHAIAACVAQLLGEGMPPAEIATWAVGRQVWQAITTHLERGYQNETA